MTQDPAETASKHDPYAAFRIPAYRHFLIGSLLVMIGTAAQGLAIGWEIYERTGQPLALGLVGLVQAVPMLLFTLPAGYLADVYDRRKLMMLSLAGATCTSVGLAVFSIMQGPGWAMYLLLFLDAAILRLGAPALSALMPLLVPVELFESAVKWRTSLFQIAGVAGPALGGFIIGWSVPAAYLCSAASTAFFILFLTTMKLPAAPRSTPGDMVGQVIEGIRFVWSRQLLLGAMSLDLFAVLLGGAVYLLPVFAKEIINLEPVGLEPAAALGWLRAAPAAGAGCMALLMAFLPPLRQAGRVLFWAVGGFGVATIVFGLTDNFWLSWGMLFLTGALDNISMVVRHTLTQLATPNQMRGRVSSVSGVFIGSSNELGGFESGLVAQWFSPVISVVSGGIGTLVVVAAWSGLFPGLRRLGTLSEIVSKKDEVDGKKEEAADAAT